ncbi:MAG: hypothetical protein KQJ78_21095 [Deltaproteobacteria bacterium]|nr:hypothetical protein [Deltaproteobacteria bacterium]
MPPALKRLVGALLVGVVVSAVMVLAMTWRITATLSPMQVEMEWTRLVVEGVPAAQTVREHYGDHPPNWARRAAVIWARAELVKWWWLPFLYAGIQFLVKGMVRRRQGR